MHADHRQVYNLQLNFIENHFHFQFAQDMKCVGVQYLAAIRALKKDGVTLKRTIHIVFVPDEETGGIAGMKIFVHSDEFKALNVGFSLDEGIASPNEEFPVFYAERSIWSNLFVDFNRNEFELKVSSIF